MKSRNFSEEHLSESKDMTDPENQSQRLSDSERKIKLVEFQQRLFHDGHWDCYFSPMLRSSNTWAWGLLTVYIGGIRLMFSSNNTANDVGFHISLIGIGLLSFGTSVAFKNSTQFRAFIADHSPQSIYYLPYDFNVAELNQILNNLGLESVEPKINYTMKEVTILKQKMNTAIEGTDTSKQKRVGEEVIKSALGSVGFFPNPGRIVLDYLIPNKEVVNELIPHPVRVSMRKNGIA